MENITPAIFEASEQKKAQLPEKRANSTGAKKEGISSGNPEGGDLGKEAVAAKTRKRTKTGCLSKFS